MPPAQIKKLLDSRNEREVLEGLRRVIEVSATQDKEATKRRLTLSTADAIHGSSGANTPLLSFGSQDSLASYFVNKAARLLVFATSCRGGPGYRSSVYQHNSKVAVGY